MLYVYVGTSNRRISLLFLSAGSPLSTTIPILKSFIDAFCLLVAVLTWLHRILQLSFSRFAYRYTSLYGIPTYCRVKLDFLKTGWVFLNYTVRLNIAWSVFRSITYIGCPSESETVAVSRFPPIRAFRTAQKSKDQFETKPMSHHSRKLVYLMQRYGVTGVTKGGPKWAMAHVENFVARPKKI